MPRKSKRFPGPRELSVDVQCGFCGKDTAVALKDILPNDTFECKKCHNVSHLSVERVSELRDRIGRMLDGLMRG